MKPCSKCKIIKNYDQYHKASRESDGLKDACKSCIKEDGHNRYLNNKDKINIQTKEWKKNNKEKRRIKQKENLEKNPIFKLARNLRKRLWECLKNKKVGSAVSDLGCTLEELKQYIESKWKPGMTWDNHNLFGWHVDHIIPLSKFDLTDREQFLKACHYTNLQPLWAEENLKKWCK